MALWAFLNGNRQRYLKVLGINLSGVPIAKGLSNETIYRMMRSGLMYWAIDRNVIDMARLFVDSGMDPGQDALFWVVEIRNVEIVKIHLETFPKITSSLLLH